MFPPKIMVCPSMSIILSFKKCQTITNNVFFQLKRDIALFAKVQTPLSLPDEDLAVHYLWKNLIIVRCISGTYELTYHVTQTVQHGGAQPHLKSGI